MSLKTPNIAVPIPRSHDQPIDKSHGINDEKDHGFSWKPVLIGAAIGVAAIGAAVLGYKFLKTANVAKAIQVRNGATVGKDALFDIAKSSKLKNLAFEDAPIVLSPRTAGKIYDAPYASPGRILGTAGKELNLVQLRTSDQLAQGTFSNYFARAEDVAGLSPQDLQRRFALPTAPEVVVPVSVQRGTPISLGVVAPASTHPGGGLQFEVLQNGPAQLGKNGAVRFATPRPLGKATQYVPHEVHPPRSLLDFNGGHEAYTKSLANKGFDVRFISHPLNGSAKDAWYVATRETASGAESAHRVFDGIDIVSRAPLPIVSR